MLDSDQLRKIYQDLKAHHSADPTLLASIRAAMATSGNKDPWKCRFCLKLNKLRANRCGFCDLLWHKCYDPYYVHGQKQQKNQQKRNYTGWNDEEAEDSNWESHSQSSHQSSKSPRQSKPKGKPSRRVRKARNSAGVPPLDPPWNSKQTPTQPAVGTNQDSNATGGQAEQQLQSLVAKLKEKDTSITPDEINQLIAESTTPVVTSKTMNQAVKKMDQARSKFQSAQKERKNLHSKWMAYLEESIKRWKSFAEDFGNKDRALEEKVNQAKDFMQKAKENLDHLKEQHSRQDAACLAEEAEVISDIEEEPMKVESAEWIQKGIDLMVTSLEGIRTRPEASEEENVSKKARLTEAGFGTSALEPFAKPNK